MYYDIHRIFNFIYKIIQTQKNVSVCGTPIPDLETSTLSRGLTQCTLDNTSISIQHVDTNEEPLNPIDLLKNHQELENHSHTEEFLDNHSDSSESHYTQKYVDETAQSYTDYNVEREYFIKDISISIVEPSSYEKIKLIGKGDVGRVYLVVNHHFIVYSINFQIETKGQR